MNLYTGEVAQRFGCQTYGIRPEHIRLSQAKGAWQGRVRHIERLGADAILYLDVPQIGEMWCAPKERPPLQQVPPFGQVRWKARRTDSAHSRLVEPESEKTCLEKFA